MLICENSISCPVFLEYFFIDSDVDTHQEAAVRIIYPSDSGLPTNIFKWCNHDLAAKISIFKWCNHDLAAKITI